MAIWKRARLARSGSFPERNRISGIFRDQERSSNLTAGFLFIAVSLCGFWFGRELNIGSLGQMGAGFFPAVVCWGLLIVGLVVASRSLRTAQEETSVVAPFSRAVALVPLSIITFGALIERLGLVIAILASVIVAGFASRGSRLLEIICAAVLLSITCVMIFGWGLGLPLQIWPEL